IRAGQLRNQRATPDQSCEQSVGIQSEPSTQVRGGLSRARPFRQPLHILPVCRILRRDVCPRRGSLGIGGLRWHERATAKRASLPKLLALWSGHLENHSPIHRDLWFAVGGESTVKGQECGQRSFHCVGPKQSSDHDLGPSRHSALQDNLRKRGTSGGIGVSTESQKTKL